MILITIVWIANYIRKEERDNKGRKKKKERKESKIMGYKGECILFRRKENEKGRK